MEIRNGILGIFKRLFCRHTEYEYRRKIQPYYNLQGETVYKFCKKCGKRIGSEFMSNEEFLLRFK